MSYYNDLHDGKIPGTEEVEHSDDGGGVQPWSKGDVYPWIHTYVENKGEGWGKHFFQHPDGRETEHRRFNLNDPGVRQDGKLERWYSIQYRAAEEDARRAIARDKQREAVKPKRPVVRTSGTLANGAEIVAQVGVVVLAKYGKEYVTWLVDKAGNASVGRYFPGNGRPANGHDLVTAMNDFGERLHAWYEHVTE